MRYQALNSRKPEICKIIECCLTFQSATTDKVFLTKGCLPTSKV